MTVSDRARLDDARLDVLLVRARSRGRLLANALRFKTGFVENSEILDHWQCRRLTVETDPALEVTADGEFLTHSPLECEVIPGALTLLAPKDH
jgi:diacylglycerol kinase family enzyme